MKFSTLIEPEFMIPDELCDALDNLYCELTELADIISLFSIFPAELAFEQPNCDATH